MYVKFHYHNLCGRVILGDQKLAVLYWVQHPPLRKFQKAERMAKQEGETLAVAVLSGPR